MYKPDTILVLKEPRGTEDEPFAFDRIRVVGQSPINHGVFTEEWTGAQGQGVIVQPVDHFGPTSDEPYGKLQALYEVESIPETETLLVQPVKVVDSASAGASPEEVFAAMPEPKPKRSRARQKPKSPLDEEPNGEAADSTEED